RPVAGCDPARDLPRGSVAGEAVLRRRVSLLAVVVVALLATLIPAEAAAATPALTIVRVAGPISVTGTNHYRPLVTMPLAPGHWIVMAKLQIDFVHPNHTHLTDSCELTTTGTGGWIDATYVKPPYAPKHGDGPTGIGDDVLLTVADTLTS